MGMFDNYKLNSTDVPSNIYEYLMMPEINCIVTGGTCYNTFKLDFPYDEELMSVSITYYQAERLSFTKTTGLEVYPVSKNYFIVKCNLTKEETALFGNTNIDTYAQVRITFGDRVLFGSKTKIMIIKTIEEK